MLTFLFCLCCTQIKSDPDANEDKDVVCFVYHRVGDSRYPSTNVSVSDFETHLKYLVSQKFQLLTLSDAIAYLKSAKPKQKTAVVTIDDGYKSFYKNGLPLLRKYKVPATLFINTETVGAGDYMDWTQLQSAMKSNVEIGNHTHSHRYFLNETASVRYQLFRDEIAASQKAIAEKLQVTPLVFSYPYGEFDNKMVSIARDAGFIGAAAQNSGVLDAHTDLFLIPRFPMSESYAAKAKFVEKSAMRALAVVEVSPVDNLIDSDSQPVLKLSIQNEDISPDKLHCFIQGGGCDLKIIAQSENELTFTVRPLQPLRRRRTLYTVTAQGKTGKWYWHSYLWVNPAVK
ncbi:MAG: polysaccharide deacetylase family protein [Chryseolinea sp.]